MPDYGDIHVVIRRKPLTGFPLWWNLNVFHTVSQQYDMYDIGLSVSSEILPREDPAKTLEEARLVWQRLLTQWGFQTVSRTFEHLRGPGFDVTAVLHGVHSGSSGRFASEHLELTYIAPRWHPKDASVTIWAWHTGSTANSYGTQSTWDEIVRSIRVVQK